jgi:hypothetical protein
VLTNFGGRKLGERYVCSLLLSNVNDLEYRYLERFVFICTIDLDEANLTQFRQPELKEHGEAILAGRTTHEQDRAL